jgi:CheY-like chemotaxis protein
MSEASNLNMQDPNPSDDIPAGLAAEIERGFAERNLASSKSTDSYGRMLDAICDAVIAETPRAAADLDMQNSSEPLASLLQTIQAEAHANVKADTHQECAESLEEIDKAAGARVAEYSLTDIAHSLQESGEIIAGDSSESKTDSAVTSAATQPVKFSISKPAKALTVPAADRRRRRRALISAPVRVRGANGGPDEISTTVDVSRFGLLFVTSLDCYSRGMDVMVTFPYSSSKNTIQAEQRGRIVRVHESSDGRRVAIALGIGVNEAVGIVDSTANISKRPLVLTVDSEAALRDSLKAYLENEGYEVIAVSSNVEAREVLEIFTPALVIAEIEGENLPGFDVCAHVKTSPRLHRIPVVLITNSAYPSDYSNAHSIGAVVCMAKPFKQERLGHVVRLLAPLPEHLQPKFTPRLGDPTRRPGCDTNADGRKKTNGAANRNGKRFKFPSFR